MVHSLQAIFHIPVLSCGSFLLAFLLLTSGITHSTAQNATVHGVVKDEGTPLPAASVSIGDKTMLTNSAGVFSISLNAGTYQLVVSHTGYRKLEQIIIINAGERQTFELKLVRDEQQSDVLVLGSRSAIQRTNMNSAVPTDVIAISKILVGQPDITRQLAVTVPSFNSIPQTFNLGAIISAASLRGLGSDETLVLLNGRRRHTTANVILSGAVATDLNTIPSIALEKVEILRDGAAAQYGSDAIAGVLDLQLKKSTGVTSIDVLLGQYYKGDGETVAFEINRGFQINKKGFINVSAAYRLANPTQRNGIYDSTVYYNIPANGVSMAYRDSIRNLDNQKVAERGFNRHNFRRIGNSKIENYSLIINGAYPVSKKLNLLWTGTFNHRGADDQSSPVYRYPKDTTTVNTALYPDGFQPHIFVSINDFSAMVAAEGSMSNGWSWDASAVYGGNSSAARISNTNNATQFALGKNAQTQFENGSTLFTQNTNNINFTRDFASFIRRVKSFTLSLGAELRIEHYQIKEGEEASWKNYAPSSGRIGGAQPQGNDTSSVTTNNRHITAAYVELEIDKNEKLLLNLAGRYEYYSDFGGNLAAKLAMRYKFNERFMLRGSFSNGFRAPAIQQRYFSTINQTGGRNNFGISVTGTYRNDSEVAAGFGIGPLEAERSLNASAGLTLKISRHINLTLDAYWIQVINRIIITGAIQRNAATPRVGQILDSLNRRDINAVRFFTNAVNTRTAGVDIVVAGRWPLHQSTLDVSVGGNYNKTKLYDVSQPAKNLPNDSNYQYTVINYEERGRMEEGTPLSKIILAMRYKTPKWEFAARFVRFGEVAHIFFGNDRARDQTFEPITTSHFNVGYTPKKWITVRVGADNAFDVYPDQLSHRANTQGGLLLYDANFTQIGYNGGYYFMKMELRF
jgi:iron complex outermembrane receptor protein